MTRNKSIIVLGGNPLNVGFLDLAKSLNCELIVVDWNGDKGIFPGAKYVEQDIKRLDLIDLLPDDLDVLLVYTSSDVACENVARISEKYELGFSSIDHIKTVVRKDLLQSKWRSAGLIKRWSIEFDDSNFKQKMDELCNNHSLANEKIVIKPSNSASSRDVYIFCGEKAIEDKIQTIKYLIEKYDQPILVEEFISGVEYSIEMVVDGQGNVDVWPVGKKYKSQFNPNETVSVKVTYNEIQNKKLEENLRNFARLCAQASGIRNTLLHLELIVDRNGRFHPIEMGCRSTGFVGSHLLDYVSQRGYVDTYISVVNGKKLTGENVEENGKVSVYFFYDFPQDIKKISFENEEAFWTKCSYTSHFSSPPLGKPLHHDDDTKKIFYRILSIDKSAYKFNEIESLEREFLEFVRVDF